MVDEADLRPLREAAQRGRQAYTEAFLGAVAANPTMAKVVPYVLYETLGPTLPEGLSGAAAAAGFVVRIPARVLSLEPSFAPRHPVPSRHGLVAYLTGAATMTMTSRRAIR